LLIAEKALLSEALTLGTKQGLPARLQGDMRKANKRNHQFDLANFFRETSLGLTPRLR
jgi:hypothetical protein